MKVLITGGRGFIGKCVAVELASRGIEPVIMDRWASSKTSVIGDVRDSVQVDDCVAKTDGVIHLAGMLGTSETLANPKAAIAVNISGSLNVFESVRRHNRPAVYIAVGNHWMNNPYSITKTTAERMAFMFNREFGTRIAVVRALNAYGPRQAAAPVRKIIPNFVIPALKREVLTVYGGDQIMDMIYVHDVADVLVRALLFDHGNYATAFEAGTGRETSVLEIAEMVVRIAGGGTIKQVPMRPGEPPSSKVVGNPETLAPLYPGGVRFVQLEDGLKQTVMWYRDQANIAVA